MSRDSTLLLSAIGGEGGQRVPPPICALLWAQSSVPQYPLG